MSPRLASGCRTHPKLILATRPPTYPRGDEVGRVGEAQPQRNGYVSASRGLPSAGGAIGGGSGGRSRHSRMARIASGDWIVARMRIGIAPAMSQAVEETAVRLSGQPLGRHGRASLVAGCQMSLMKSATWSVVMPVFSAICFETASSVICPRLPARQTSSRRLLRSPASRPRRRSHPG